MKDFKDLKKNLKREFPSYPTVRVAVLGDTATQFLGFAIKGMGIERGYNIDLFEAEYNQIERQLLDPTSELYEFEPEFVIIFQSSHKFVEHHALLNSKEQSELATQKIDFARNICLNPKLQGKKIIFFNYAEIDDTVFGSFANKIESSLLFQIRKLNMELMSLSQEFSNLFILDVSSIQNKFGRNNIFSPNIYVGSDMILNTEVLPYVASRIMDIISAIKGNFKKCLILDLDNTIWGGVIGDDGLEGIQLGHGLGIGKAFSEFQLWVKKLRQRGVILCVASKNNEDIAKEPFEKHPDMILKLDDIAVFQANWETKVDNIRAIQQILNIGFDSMVFLDDNPFERNMVRENIPHITVPELPEDPAEYLEFLYSLNLFETASFSEADKDRTKQYQTEAKRVSLSKTFENEDDFLKSLNMISEVSGFNKFNTPRVAQLSQRSNQFNLRTVRYTDDEIAKLAEDPEIIDLAFTLKDKFGDNGLIGVIIMKPIDKETLFIDTWFMSCRVLKRGMENFMLNQAVEKARERGFKKIIGEYIPTLKNGIVANHYPSLGFILLNKNADGKANFELNLNLFESFENNIKIYRNQ